MISLDQSRKNELSFYGEAVRLSNEFRDKPARSYVNNAGITVNVPAFTNGFNVESVNINTMRNFRGQSQAQKDFLTIIIKMRSGLMDEDIELLGETGYNKKERKKLNADHLL